jgi:TetR/AcrR family transcriptional regulator of autoinduction and epiphytic fitness
MTDTTDSATETDGRRLRRSRNRDAAVDALLALYREGRLDPSAAEIAERAELSPRSLFRYFDDVDDLVRSAIERQTQIVFPALERRVDTELGTAERIEQFVDLRLALFATVGRVGRVTRLHAPFHDEIRSNLAVMRTYLRRQIELTFAAELSQHDATQRRSTIAALDVMCSYESVDLLLDDQGLSHAQTRATLVRGVTALLRTA